MESKRGKKHYNVPNSMQNIFINSFQKKMFEMPIDGNVLNTDLVVDSWIKFPSTLYHRLMQQIPFFHFVPQSMILHLIYSVSKRRILGMQQEKNKIMRNISLLILFERSDYDVEKIQS